MLIQLHPSSYTLLLHLFQVYSWRMRGDQWEEKLIAPLVAGRLARSESTDEGVLIFPTEFAAQFMIHARIRIDEFGPSYVARMPDATGSGGNDGLAGLPA
jgi:hypothetical protein